MQVAQGENITLSSDDTKNDIRTSMPRILEILLLDRTTSTPKTPKNIIWANDNYIEYGAFAYAATAQIKIELITGARSTLIMPRVLKHKSLQKERTRTKAEVFTPTWIVKMQNDSVDESYLSDDIERYTSRKWLEITCGEAPYMEFGDVSFSVMFNGASSTLVGIAKSGIKGSEVLKDRKSVV